MALELRSRKIGDHSTGLKEMITPSMIRCLKMGFNNVGSWIKRIIYNLFNKVKSKGFLAALIGSPNDENAWIIDSGASRHMTRDSKKIHTLSKEQYSDAVEMGDNKIYVLKGLGSTSLKLDNGAKIHINNILYVPGLKKNLLSIYSLEDKGDRFSFVDGKVFAWGKYSSFDKSRVISIREGSLYRVITPSPQAIVHMEINPIEL